MDVDPLPQAPAADAEAMDVDLPGVRKTAPSPSSVQSSVIETIGPYPQVPRKSRQKPCLSSPISFPPTPGRVDEGEAGNAVIEVDSDSDGDSAPSVVTVPASPTPARPSTSTTIPASVEGGRQAKRPSGEDGKKAAAPIGSGATEATAMAKGMAENTQTNKGKGKAVERAPPDAGPSEPVQSGSGSMNPVAWHPLSTGAPGIARHTETFYELLKASVEREKHFLANVRT